MPKSNKRSDGLGAIRPKGRVHNLEFDLMDYPSDRLRRRRMLDQGKEKTQVLKSSNRSDGLRAIRPKGRVHILKLTLC